MRSLSAFTCLGFLFITLNVGCTHIQLRDNAKRQATTLTDIRYAQVLDNLAMSVSNPGIMPFFALVTDGTTQIQNSGQANAMVSLDPRPLFSEAFGLSGSSTVGEQWGLSPIKEPERLEAMECVYRWVLHGSGSDCTGCKEILDRFKVFEDVLKVDSGAFHFGKKRDVPKEACFVGQYQKSYVWVNAAGLISLTKLASIILDIATVDLASLSAEETKVREITYDVNGAPTGYKETIVVPIKDKVPANKIIEVPKFSPAPFKLRREFYPGGLRGSIILPRPQ
jgi:hypothetical protein